MKTILFIMIGLSSFLSADFTRDANGIVTDNSTDLQWQDDALGSTMSWQSAIDHCEDLTLGGYEDWRLPNLNVLTSLVDDTKISPSIDDIFQNISFTTLYWSSTTFNNSIGNAWSVFFNGGNHLNRDKRLILYVRCVRAGE